MSLRALLEIVVHLESFRNIDLFFQGLYYLKVTLYNKKNDEVSEYKMLAVFMIYTEFHNEIHKEYCYAYENIKLYGRR
jgi:hypothetical protein